MKNHIAIISTILVNVTAVTNAASDEKETGTINITERETRYILKDYNGRIALFKEKEIKPLTVYNIFTNSLPEADIKMLKNGITVKENELERLLEEYTS